MQRIYTLLWLLNTITWFFFFVHCRDKCLKIYYMKKLFPIVLAILFIACKKNDTSNEAIWTALSSGTTNDLNSVFFTNDSTGYVVGQTGIILKTANKGSNWMTLKDSTNQDLNSVFFSSIDTGYAVGDSGTILRTSDGGTHWISLSIGRLDNLNSVYFTSVNTGYVVSSLGNIFKTSNAGTTWTSTSVGIGNELHSVYFADLNTGYAVGLYNGVDKVAPAPIFKTTNGGATWVALSSGTDNSSLLWSVYFTNDLTGYAVGRGIGYGFIIKTVDGGLSWTPIQSQLAEPLFSVYFTDENTGYIAAGNYIMSTTTGGSTWKFYEVTTLLNSVYFPNANSGYAVGLNGAIFKCSFN